MRLIHLVSLCFRVYVSDTLGPFLLALYVICFYYYDLLCLLSRFWPIVSALSASHITIFNLTFFSTSNEVACLCICSSALPGHRVLPVGRLSHSHHVSLLGSLRHFRVGKRQRYCYSPTASERAEGLPWMTQADLQ
ncbi:hypothetical protein HBI65_211050 [Parastagonospora nodorum]|nr:hypothetical protein HBH74_093490 [Parastagonospora nodorum]KAH4946408.1 hypothetical protein HBH73_140650 [Parastagonospora nodorum]KAH5297588.1 hypothetical protein HBI11_158200 [Parastagonospora nodorum]KAH5352419.1 hypothetical protein HBI48_152190 [Parastagonospora nodorum]KAH5471620.1 hypothetical protein HBI28_143270 [Parastagonospora nodorum]